MNDAAAHTSTGAYVVHALSDRERERFEQHMEHCEACRREVAELEATAAELGAAAAVPESEPQPAGTKQAVLRRVAATEQEAPVWVPQQRVRRFRGRVAALVTAAAVAAAATLGGVAVWQHEVAVDARDQRHSVEQQAAGQQAAIADVLSASDTQLSSQRLADGGVASVAASRSRDSAVFIADGLRELPRGRAYQVWFTGSGAARSGGVLPGDDARQLRLLDGPVAGASDVDLTVEPAGGSPQPTTPSLATIRLPG
ncbi:anti-sigma factor domain-containing protein [Streptomyces sp. NPDC049040]|uniref:anti-sigma factor n=1 Tax=Streptomyces sp. NPDC049040 TaxID=3365593 RepID=UPI003719C39C